MDLELFAASVLQRAGLDPAEAHGAITIAHKLGIRLRRYDRPFADGDVAHAERRGDSVTIWYRPGIPEHLREFVLAHEISESELMRLGLYDGDMEAAANAVAAALLMPPASFRAAVRDHGINFRALAADFAVAETAVALRAGEVGAVAGLVVVTPERIYARTAEAVVLPPKGTLRKIARGRAPELPGLRRVNLSERRRVALVVDADPEVA